MIEKKERKINVIRPYTILNKGKFQKNTQTIDLVPKMSQTINNINKIHELLIKVTNIEIINGLIAPNILNFAHILV